MKQLLRNQVLIIVLLSFFAFGCTKESDPAPSPAEQLAAQLVQGTWRIDTYIANGVAQTLTNQDRARRFTYRLGANSKTSGRITITTAQDVIEADWRLTDPTTLVLSGGGEQIILTEVSIQSGMLSYVELDGNIRHRYLLVRV